MLAAPTRARRAQLRAKEMHHHFDYCFSRLSVALQLVFLVLQAKLSRVLFKCDCCLNRHGMQIMCLYVLRHAARRFCFLHIRSETTIHQNKIQRTRAPRAYHVTSSASAAARFLLLAKPSSSLPVSSGGYPQPQRDKLRCQS